MPDIRQSLLLMALCLFPAILQAQTKAVGSQYQETIRTDDLDISVRELRSGRVTITGLPTFLSGIKFADGTVQTSSPTVTVKPVYSSTQSYAGNQTISSTASPGTSISGSTMTLTVAANSVVEYCFNATFDDNSATTVKFDFYLDGTKTGTGTNSSFSLPHASNGTLVTAAACFVTNSLSSGSHNLWLQAWSVGGSGAFEIQKTNPPMYIAARELK